MNQYQRVHHEAAIETQRKRTVAATWAHIWNDPFVFLAEDETEFNRQGGIAHEKSKRKLADILFTQKRQPENIAILKMYQLALWGNAKVVYIDVVADAARVDTIPRIEIAKHKRDCAVCGVQTSSGIRALCDSCHNRFIIEKNFKNTPLRFEDVAEAIWRSDTRHRASVQHKLAS